MASDLQDLDFELKEFIGETFEINKALDSISEEDITGALKILNAYRDDFTPDILNAGIVLAKAAGAVAVLCQSPELEINKNDVLWPSLVGGEKIEREKADEDDEEFKWPSLIR